MKRLELLKKRKESILKNDKIDSLSKYLNREMVERGKQLDPYEAMLHARRMAKKVNMEENKLFKNEGVKKVEFTNKNKRH